MRTRVTPVLDLGRRWDPDDVVTSSHWRELASSPGGDDREPIVDVIIPVYGARDHALRAIYSALASPQMTPYRVVVIDDASPDDGLDDELRFLATELGLIEFYRNDVNQGFPATCNRGFNLHPDRDVVILNSDVLVYNDWLDRLRSHVLADPTIGTVTPLTSNGEICSYPEMGISNDYELELSPSDLDALAAVTNPGVRVDTPTGVGFCMYITRDCLDATQGFDAEAFGSGYGEENDLCQRAAAAGLRSVLCADVYAWHRGGATFGESKNARVEVAVDLVESRHPSYLASVYAHIKANPLRHARCRLDAARINRRSSADANATLHVLHLRGGGTERHVTEHAAQLEAGGRRSLLCQPGTADGTFSIRDPQTPYTPNLARLSDRTRPDDLADLFRLLRIDTIHVHHLMGFGDNASEFFMALAELLGAALDVTLHDYTMICPRINLISYGEIYCGEPDVSGCERCVETLGSPFGKPSVWQWRRNHHRFLRSARQVIAPSRDVATRFERYYPDVPVDVRSHDEPPLRTVDRTNPPAMERSSSRVGVLGAVGVHKGSRIMLRVAKAAAATDLPLEVVLIGYSDINKRLLATDKVRITGEYEESELGQLIFDEGVEAIWFPAVWPETYSYTLTAALEADVPILAFELGAIAERLRASDRDSRLLPVSTMDDPDQILHAMRELLPAGSPAALATQLRTRSFT